MKRKALIISLKGENLSQVEKKLLSKGKPWGVILFKRNLKSFEQVKNLTFKIKKLTKDKKFPIMVDEEGESVSRLRNLINNNVSANYFGNLFKNDKSLCFNILKHYIKYTKSLTNIKYENIDPELSEWIHQ